MSDLLDRISEELTVPKDALKDALDLAHVRYRKIRVRKRSGGVRVMIQPSAELKPILGWLNERVFSKLPVSGIATAFGAGMSIVKNAYAHRRSRYSVRIDITDFFHSIRSADLSLAIRNASTGLPEWVVSQDALETIRLACFNAQGRLPIGYSTSPAIANAVMHTLDSVLIRVIQDQSRFGQAALTRYADDFLFSTDKVGACREFLTELKEVLSSTSNPKLKVNDSKTRFMSLRGGSTLVTGLRVKLDHTVGIHPKYRDHIRMLMKLHSANRLAADELNKLRGHLAFIEHADPRLFTKLSFKYFRQIAELRGQPQAIS